MLDIGFLPDLQRILSLPAQAAPDAAVLGHVLARDQAPGRELPAGPDDWSRWRGPTPPPPTSSSISTASPTDDKRRAVLKLLKERAHHAGVRVRQLQARLRPPGALVRARRPAAPTRCTATSAGRAAEGARGVQDAARSTCWSRTDVAARGLDIVDLPAVFNFDVPFNAEDYVHRIGRTGRAGASGLAVTLVSRDDARLVADIEKLIKKKIELEPLELDDDAPPRRAPRERVARRRRLPRRAPKAVASPCSARTPGRELATPPRPPSDPFFDKPYEPSATDGRAGLGRSAPRRSPRGLSPNIKPKKKVAALFGGKVPETGRDPDAARQRRQQREHRRHVGRQGARALRATARRCRFASSRRRSVRPHADRQRASPAAGARAARRAAPALR